MSPLGWRNMSFRKRADAVLRNIEGLTEEEIQEVRDEWADRPYPDVPNADIEALNDLQSMAMRAVHEKYGLVNKSADEMVARLLKGKE